jgi:hypothetical protein
MSLLSGQHEKSAGRNRRFSKPKQLTPTIAAMMLPLVEYSQTLNDMSN